MTLKSTDVACVVATVAMLIGSIATLAKYTYVRGIVAGRKQAQHEIYVEEQRTGKPYFEHTHMTETLTKE